MNRNWPTLLLRFDSNASLYYPLTRNSIEVVTLKVRKTVL